MANPSYGRLEDLPRELLVEKEKKLDEEINEEVEKVKMTSDFVSTLKKMDTHLNDTDPLNFTGNLNNIMHIDALEQEACIDYLEREYANYEHEENKNSPEAQPSSLEQQQNLGRRPPVRNAEEGEGISARSG